MAGAVAADQEDGHSHAFQVVTALTNETLLFAAESDQDAKEWIRVVVNLDILTLGDKIKRRGILK